MWVVSLRRLREFWAIHPLAEVPLRAWFTQMSAADWRSFSDLRGAFPSADLVRNCTVFNFGGNKYRLITRVFYPSHKVYVLRVLTHAEYDREEWPTHCGCYQPPPDRARATRGKLQRNKRRPRKRRPRS
jgi:mRNA interferase HigB